MYSLHVDSLQGFDCSNIIIALLSTLPLPFIENFFFKQKSRIELRKPQECIFIHLHDCQYLQMTNPDFATTQQMIVLCIVESENHNLKLTNE